MTGSVGNVVRQAEVDSFMVVAVVREAEKYVCNRCKADTYSQITNGSSGAKAAIGTGHLAGRVRRILARW